MNPPDLYDLSPLAALLAVGALLALLALLWVWRGNPKPAARLRALTLLTLFLTFDLVVFGAFTRLTDSGLGCPDWPGCYAQASPLGASAQINAAQQALPSGPVTPAKAWIEMIHRYLATAVGALIVLLLVLHYRWRQAAQPMPLAAGSGRIVLAWLTLVWVCLQGAFGAWTVTMKLFPAIVTLHLLGGLGLLALLGVQAALDQPWLALPEPNRSDARRWPHATLPGALALALVLLQAALGAWVSANYAVLACADFPLCQGRWWPEMDFANGFTLWRELGLSGDGSVLSFQALTAIHIVHRWVALPVLLLLGWCAWCWQQTPALTAYARWLWLLLAAQALTGLGNVLLGWPLLAALAHSGGAGALVLLLSVVLTRQYAAWVRPERRLS